MAIKIDYEFIKSEEAKEIFTWLERKRMLEEDYACGYDLDEVFIFKDEEKKKMVERFIFEAKVPYQAFQTIEKRFIDIDYRRFKTLLDSAMELKMSIDPDYIYEKWLVESRALKFECMYLSHNEKDPTKYLMGIGVI
jgi:hypothetical protein